VSLRAYLTSGAPNGTFDQELHDKFNQPKWQVAAKYIYYPMHLRIGVELSTSIMYDFLHLHLSMHQTARLIFSLPSRASTFFRVPVAHAFLNGLVRGFWRMACRDAKKNSGLSKGQEAIISKAAQNKIAANVNRMCPTSEFDSAFKNIIECVQLPNCFHA
jgi:hypothetical protein